MSQGSHRVRRPRAEWKVIVADWERSGLSSAAYASSRGLNQNTLKWWRRQLKKEGEPVSLVELVPRQPPVEPSKIEVSVGEHTVRLPGTCGPFRAALLVATLLWAR